MKAFQYIAIVLLLFTKTVYSQDPFEYGQEEEEVVVVVDQAEVGEEDQADNGEDETEEEIERSLIPFFNKKQVLSPFESKPSYIDTTLTSFQIYDFARQKNLFIAHKGNVGHASRSMKFDPDFNIGFTPLMQNNHEAYLFRGSELDFIRPRHVFTELNWVVGAEREQLFYAKHAQKLSDDAYMGFCYRIINSPGLYDRLASRDNNLYGLFDYSGFDNRYQLLATASYNRIMNHESAGISNREDFEEVPARLRVFLDRAYYRYKDLELKVNNSYRFGIDYSVKLEEINTVDTLEVDEPVEKERFNLGRLEHELAFHRQSFLFEESAEPYPFFESEPFNQQMTFDSTVVVLLQNELAYSNFPLEGETNLLPFNFSVFVRHQYIEMKMPFLQLLTKSDEEEEEEYLFDKRSYAQYIPGAKIQTNPNRFLSLFGEANFTIGGYNHNDYFLLAGLNLGKHASKHRAQLEAKYIESEAPYFLNYYRGNYHGWENKFSKMQIASAKASYTWSGIEIEANYHSLNGYIFLNESIVPEQNASTVNALTFSLKNNHIFWNVLGFRNNIVYQLIPGGQIDDYPELISYHSLFVNGAVFGKALQFQIGFDLYYNSPYFPSAYMPVVMQFYQQSEYKSDHVFMLDAFLNVKISDVRVFLKYQNLGGFLYQESPVYHLPYYPVPEAMFKFGISWMFFN